MKKYLCVALLAAFDPSYCFAEEEADPAALFTLINTVPNSDGFKCYIQNSKVTNMLTPVDDAADEPAGMGFSTGLAPWSPADGELVAEVPSRSPVTLKPFIKPGETPLIILKARGSGSLEFSLLPKPTDRESAFYDAVNLTPQAELELTVDGRVVRLPRGQRVRLSRDKKLRYEVAGGPKDVLESVNDPSHVMIFYGDDKGKIKCMVVADRAP